MLLTMRVSMELSVIAAFGYWGYHLEGSSSRRIAAAIIAPAIGFGIWGAVDFRQAGRYGEPLRLIEEITISGLAAGALYWSGRHNLAWALGSLSLAYHALVYPLGSRLLKAQPINALPVQRLDQSQQGENDPNQLNSNTGG